VCYFSMSKEKNLVAVENWRLRVDPIILNHFIKREIEVLKKDLGRWQSYLENKPQSCCDRTLLKFVYSFSFQLGKMLRELAIKEITSEEVKKND